MSDALVPVDPTSAAGKEAILALLGTTLAELKAIDKNVVGSSKHIAGNRTNLENVFKITQDNQPPTSNVIPVTTPNTNSPSTQQPPQLTAQTIQQSTAIEVNEDPNQLVFDFNQKITPDTINNKLDRILDKLERVIDKLDKR